MTEPMIPENGAEASVLEAFESRAGGVDLEGYPLRAGFLRDLFLGRLGNGKDWEPRRVVITRANVPDMLDLNYCNVPHPLCFFDCCFMNGISLEDTTVPALDLRGSRIKSTDPSGYVFMANGLRAMDVKLIDGFVAEGSVGLGGANIEGEFNCGGGQIGGTFFAQNLKATIVFLNRGFVANGDVKLTGASIKGQLVCVGGKFEKNLILCDLTTGSVMFDENFRARGMVNLARANVSNHIVCKGIFEGFPDVQSVDVCFTKEKSCFVAEGLKTGRLSLTGEFRGKGRANLSGAEIRGLFDCEGGKFEGGILAEFLEAESVLLREGFKAEGEVRLLNASISGQLDCRNGAFETGLNLTDATIGVFHSNERGWPREGHLHLDGFHYRRLAGGAGDSAMDGLEWLNRMEDGKFHPQPYEQLMAVYRRMGRADWAREIGFELESRRHDKFREIQQNEEWHELVVRNVWRIGYRTLRATIGYGYKPFRFLGWLLALWLGGALAFGGASLCDCGRWPPQSEKEFVWALGGMNRSECLGDLIIPSEGDVLISDGWKSRQQIPKGYPRFVPATYALEALFPVLDFGQLDKWHPRNGWLSLLRWGMTFSGTVLLAILTFFGLGALGPRWRDGEDSG